MKNIVILGFMSESGIRSSEGSVRVVQSGILNFEWRMQV